MLSPQILKDIKMFHKIEASRQTFILQYTCSTCGGDTDAASILREDSFAGVMRMTGYRFCKVCKSTVENKKKYIERNYIDYVLYSSAKKFEKNLSNLYFLRNSVSLGKTFIQDECKLCMTNGDCIKIRDNRVIINICWGGYFKSIYLANVIYFNPKVFGFKTEHFKFKKTSRKLLNFLKKEYEIANKLRYLLLCNKSKNNKMFFDDNIMNIIFKYWNNFY